jgi:Protein of unknown function (DUF3307).
MNNNILFWLLMCGHLVGDFYVQPQVLAEKKMKKTGYLLLHSIIYALSVFIFILSIFNFKMLIICILVFISHFAIDFIKIKLNGDETKCNFFTRNSFCIDQIVHMAIIVLIASFYANSNTIAVNYIGKALLYLYNSMQMNFAPIMSIKYLFVILLIGKPSNILIKNINKKEYIRKTSDNKIIEIEKYLSEYQNAGKIIGILERLLVVIMIAMKQYAAIGLIFTAKSITRYDKITKEPAFAEYYLVGTLLSLLISIISALLIQV